MKFIASLIIVLSSLSCFAQNHDLPDIPEAQKRIDSLKGTYELRKYTRDLVMLPSNLADIILSNRKANEMVVVKLNELCDLVIYPLGVRKNEEEKTAPNE